MLRGTTQFAVNLTAALLLNAENVATYRSTARGWRSDSDKSTLTAKHEVLSLVTAKTDESRQRFCNYIIVYRNIMRLSRCFCVHFFPCNEHKTKYAIGYTYQAKTTFLYSNTHRTVPCPLRLDVYALLPEQDL